MAMLFSKVLFDLAENLISSYLYPLKCECEVRRCLNEKYLHYRHKTQIYSKFFCPPPQKLKFYPTYGYEKKNCLRTGGFSCIYILDVTKCILNGF